MSRANISSGAVWEDQVGYSRVVVVGKQAWVSGTVGEGETAYEQMRDAIGKAKQALAEAGFGLRDVVRTRMFVTDISSWEEIGRAHREAFGTVRPATTMVEISRLIVPRYLCEIEMEAILGNP